MFAFALSPPAALPILAFLFFLTPLFYDCPSKPNFFKPTGVGIFEQLNIVDENIKLPGICVHIHIIVEKVNVFTADLNMVEIIPEVPYDFNPNVAFPRKSCDVYYESSMPF